MTSLIGYNVHATLTYGRGYSTDEKRRFWEHLEKLQPTSLLFLDDIDFAREAKRRLPKTIVIFREYRQNDGRLFMDMTARAFYDTHIRFAEGGLVVSVMNEPTGYPLQNKPEDLEFQAAFMAEVMRLFGEQQAAICGPEFGVGHPALDRLSELDVMWAAFKQWPLHYYSAHEYGTYRGMQYEDATHQRDVYPHRVGRYKSIIAYVRAKFNYELPILINEWGIDSSFYAGDDTNKRGWRDSGLNEAQYALALIKCAKEVYVEPNVKGLNIFSHGNTGNQGSAEDWRTHDVAFLPAFQAALEAYSLQNQPAPPAVIATTYPALPLPNANNTLRSYVNRSGERYRVRELPILNAKPEIAWIEPGQSFNVVPDVEFRDGGLTWIQVRVGLLWGWASADVLTVKPETPANSTPDLILLTICTPQELKALVDIEKRAKARAEEAAKDAAARAEIIVKWLTRLETHLQEV